jgi:plasmid maintenance system antidote protein VapI
MHSGRPNVLEHGSNCRYCNLRRYGATPVQSAPLQSAAHLKDTLVTTGRNLVTRKMDERSLSITALALRLGVSRKHVSGVLNGRAPLTEQFARQLAQALGLDADLLMTLRHRGRVPKPLSEVRMPGVVLLSDPTEPMEHWWEE